MKNLNFIIAMLVMISVTAKSQVVTKAGTESKNEITKIAGDKNQVIFCDYATDTLTKEQFRNCDKIRVLTDKNMEVVSYTLVYRNGSDIFEHNGTGNSLPERVITQILEQNVTAFWLESITVIKDTNKFNLGARKYYLKG